jgi:hypothetical protein
MYAPPFRMNKYAKINGKCQAVTPLIFKKYATINGLYIFMQKSPAGAKCFT